MNVQEQFKKKPQERLQKPLVQSARISAATNMYKIKLRQLGYRLVYKVEGETVTVLAIEKRERNGVYIKALSRL